MAAHSSVGQSLLELLIALFVLCTLFFIVLDIYQSGSEVIAQWRWNHTR